MTRIQKLFLLLIIIGPLHMAEQLVTGIEEFYAIRQFFGGYYAWFPAAAANCAYDAGTCAAIGGAGFRFFPAGTRERVEPRNDGRHALSSRAFWVLISAVCGSTIAVSGTMVHLAALLTDRGVSSSDAALVLSVMGAATLAGRLLTGWLLDRYAAVRVSFWLLLIAASGTFVLAGSGSFEAAALAAALIGFGTGGEFDVIPFLLSRYFGLRALSTLYGLNWTAWGLAGAAGPMLMGRTFDTTGSYAVVLVGFGAATLAAAALTLTLPAVDPARGSNVAV